MPQIIEPPDQGTYNVRTVTSDNVQQALYQEQGRRQSTKAGKVPLMEIAAEWLEEKAQEVLVQAQ
jgi:hypothetical protein